MMFLATFLSLATTAIAVLAVYITSLMVYRVFLHPLSRYPGPFLAKITDLYTLYYAWTGYRHVNFLEQHAKYGPVFRYGPNRLSFNTHTALHAIHSAKANVRKSDFYHGFDNPNGSNLVSYIQKDAHSRKRRILAFAFSDRAIFSMEQYMLNNIRILCDKLASTSEPLNMAQWCTYLAGDVLGDLAFGKSFNALTSPQNRASLEVISDSGKFILLSGASYQLRETIIPLIFYRKLLKGLMSHRAFSIVCATERTKMVDSGRRDFYHYLMEAKNPETDEKLSMPEVWVEAGTFIAAGSDTTSLVLAATFHYLTCNPATLLAVQREVRDKFKGQGVEAIVGGPELTSCKYLKACLDETMRMTPPTPGMLPRTVLPGGITIGEHVIPAGVEVGTPYYALFHNPLYFKDSFTYRPERWLLSENATEAEKAELRVSNSAFAPFSLGPRGCIGKNMAVLEMMVTMARLVFMFDFEGGDFVAKSETGAMGIEGGEYVVKDHFICGKDGPMISFKPVTA